MTLSNPLRFEERTVSKVGRKWAAFEGDAIFDRFEIESLQFAHRYPRRAIYLSKQQYDDEKQREETWGQIRKHVLDQYFPPKTISVEQTESIAKVLGV